MRRTDVVIVGGGQAGLAMSRCLSDRAIDHVVLERGRVAERWRTERWDSLQLLTPNWQTRLPGFRYAGPDPNGFMTMPQLISFLECYAGGIGAPVETGTTVIGVDAVAKGYRVRTDRGEWRASNVVIATGYNDVPHVPAMSAALRPDIVQTDPTRYRRPADLPDGGVLVVGSSATGVQLADEIHASGRPVTMAVGRHMRLPRRYRGRDILWWLDAMGVFDETTDHVYDYQQSRRQPSFQLAGRDDRASLDLATLRERGVGMVGHALGAEGTRVHFDDDFIATTVASDAKLAVLLRRIDAFIASAGGDVDAADPEPFEPYWPWAFEPTPAVLDLRAEGIRSVLWATGFRRSYPWLHAPVFDRHGEIAQSGGVTPLPGLYVLGFHFQRRRKSAFIDGVGEDAAELACGIARRLGAHGSEDCHARVYVKC